MGFFFPMGFLLLLLVHFKGIFDGGGVNRSAVWTTVSTVIGY